MNKKAFSGNLILGIMLGVVFYIVMVTMIPGIKSVTDYSRSEMNCDATDNTTGVQMSCISMDIFLFMFIGLVFGYIWDIITGNKKLDKV